MGNPWLLTALLVACFAYRSFADCPAPNDNFYMIASLMGGQDGYYGYLDDYGPYLSFAEDFSEAHAFYLDSSGQLHSRSQNPDALGFSFKNNNGGIKPPFAVSFYKPNPDYDQPVMCSMEPQPDKSCGLFCSLDVSQVHSGKTKTYTHLYTCFGCDAKRHRCLNFGGSQVDNSDLRCKHLKLFAQAVQY